MSKSVKRFLTFFSCMVFLFLLSSVAPVFASSKTPTIGGISYTTAPLVVGQQENVRFTLSENTTSIARSYYIELYAIRNGISYLKSKQSVTLPTRSRTKTVNMPVTFSDPGSVFTKVVVYTALNGTKLIERTGKYSDTITADTTWKIEVVLPKDRTKLGTITLYESDGSIVRSSSCLGLSESGKSPLKLYGNTPKGTYDAVLDWPYVPNTYSYGPYKIIRLTGVSGQILQAQANGRSGILIHGGDPAKKSSPTYPLRVTEGCVRISNSDMYNFSKSITTLINNGYLSKGTVVVKEQ